MTAYLKRLVSSLAAYQLADVVSKFIAVILLPVYTRYITPEGYGVVELLANGVILVSILVRFGMIEAFLRYYFTDEDQERRDALARRAVLFLLIATTIVALILAAFAAPVSRVVLGYQDVTTLRIAILGLWTFTNLELAYGAAARRRAPAPVRGRVGEQRAADRGVVGGPGGGRSARAPAGSCWATTAPRRWFCSRCGSTLRHRLRPRRRPGGARCAYCCASGCPPSPPRPRCTR